MDARAQVKQYIDVAWRRKWWIVVPTILGLAGALYVAKTTPKLYRASTTILVVRQSVPEDIVRSTITMRIEERMKSLKVQVLSRRYLERVAREFGKLHDGDGEAAVERVCRRLASGRVDLEWDRQGFSWFRIVVDDENPKTAAGMANRLAELFIEQNSEMREQQAKGTVDTIETWRKQYGERLEQKEKEIADYKQAHIDELPEHEGANLQLLNNSTTQIAQLTSEIQARTDRLTALRDADAARRAAPSPGTVPIISGDPDAAALALLQRELQDLLTDYTEENPLVKRKREQITQFEANHPHLSTSRAVTGDDGRLLSPEEARLQAEIKRLEADRAREQARVDELRRRIDNIPKVQQELAQKMRGIEVLKQEYDNIASENERAKRAQDIEYAKKGEQFTVQDHASPPAVPFKPQVSTLLLMGLVAGLGLGVALAVLMEFLDHTVKNEEDFVAAYPDLPVLGAIPNLDRDAGRRRRHHRHEVQSAAKLVVVAAAAAAFGCLTGGILG